MADEHPSLLARLKRHHIFRVASVYAIAAWVLIQLGNSVFPDLGWSRQSVLILIVALLLGFPVALVLGWMLIPPSRDDPEKYSRWQKWRWRLGSALSLTIIVLVTISGGLLWRANARHLHAQQARAAATVAPVGVAAPARVIPARSVAVLPFENLSPDKNNAYFAAGLQDEILTKLANIGGIKVIARTSVAKYRSHPEDLKPVGEGLGVATILEGSVQKASNRVLINLQLVEAQDNSQIWAASYERTLNDVFGVEDEVAKRVAAALQTNLSAAQLEQLTAVPTSNTAAYDAYLRGVANKDADEFDAAALQQTANNFSQAVQLDPGFAVAWAKLATVQSEIYAFYDHTSQRLQLATRAMDRALALKPDLGETQLALGNYYQYGRRDFVRAAIAYQRAVDRMPNNSQAIASLGYLDRRRGDWRLALEHGQQALVLDPLDAALLAEVAGTYGALGRYPNAQLLLNRGLEVKPGSPDLLIQKAAFYTAQGDLRRAAEVLSGIRVPLSDPGDFLMAVQQPLYRRDYAAAAGMLETMLAKPQPGLYLQQGVFGEQLAFVEQLAGDRHQALARYARARQALRDRLKEDPNNPLIFAWLGLTEAGLGHRRAALAAGRRAIALMPVTADALQGPAYEEVLARIEVRIGENDRAIATLRHLLMVPYGSIFYGGRLTVALLNLDPAWDPLRKRPAFQALLKQYAQYKRSVLPSVPTSIAVPQATTDP